MVEDVNPDWHPANAAGQRLRKWCEASGHSQRQLAQDAGISAKHLNVIIAGRTRFSAAVAVRLARATGISARLLYRLQADAELEEALGERKPV